MLQSLHVKNLALIEEAEVEFGKGLNILTGETGAGKSLLIDSVTLALGGKFEKEMLRKGADSAFVELVFDNEDEKVSEALRALDLEDDEDCVIISRKIQAGKSAYKINGETVTARQVKELAEALIDIHGQHEHQSLLHKKKHREILDAYCGEAYREPAGKVADLYRLCRELSGKLEEESMDDSARERERSLAEFECREIEEANLTVGEDESLEKSYRFMANSRKIAENLAECHQYTGGDSENGAGGSLSRAMRVLGSVSAYDERLALLERQLGEVDSLLADFNRDVAEYLQDCEFDPEEFDRVEERLNLVNRLKGKYGGTIEKILEYRDSRQELLKKLSDYDSYMRRLKEEWEDADCRLKEACEELSLVRRENAAQLEGILKNALVNLNFLTVEFEIAVRPGQPVTADGYDDVELLLSTNPGEPPRPLDLVASGGELSRVMLAIKTVLAERDHIDTLIFDEIDTGISGRTAWKVSEQLDVVAHAHQVICITHLPQIAAMADRHFVIEKSSTDNSTSTVLHSVEGEESLAELARLLGSDTLTDAALGNAREMREQALRHKGE